PRGLRHRRVRLLPGALDAARGRGHARPFRRRARSRRRPRARRRLAAPRRAHDRRVTVELDSLAELEPALRSEGFFGREDVVAHVYVGYATSDGLRRSGLPAPPEPCALPAVAYAIERAGAAGPPASGRYAIGPWRTSWSEAAYAEAVEAARAAIAEGDVYQVN